MAVYAMNRPALVRNADIVRLRAFPSVGEILVSTGSAVERETVLGLYSSRQMLRSVRVESTGEEISATVLVAVGQKVKRGEVLAYYSYLFGLGYTEYTSPCDGEVVGISQVTGQISIKQSPIELGCHLPGTVHRTDEALGVWVGLRGDLINARAGAGFARSGILTVKASDASSPAQAGSIGPDDSGKIVLAGSSVSEEFIVACLRYRVAGIIASSAPYRVFQWYRDLAASLDWDEFLARYWARELKDKDAEVPRQAEIVPALVLTGGFGEFPMAPEVFDLLVSHKDEMVFIDGGGALAPDLAGYLDAGPCVIAAPPEAASEPSPEKKAGIKEARPGSRVRVNRVSGVPVEGVLESVAEERQLLPNGITVPCVTVVTEKGERLVVPALNVQITGS
jgi:hypothetical protein